MTHSNHLNDAFEALIEVPPMQCYAFGAVAIVGLRGTTYLRLTDTVQGCHIWYVNDNVLPGWRGVDDEKLMDELSQAYAASIWHETLLPIENMGTALACLTCPHPETSREDLH